MMTTTQMEDFISDRAISAKEIANVYAQLPLDGVDWAAVNGAIVGRFGREGLRSIKKRAWGRA